MTARIVSKNYTRYLKRDTLKHLVDNGALRNNFETDKCFYLEPKLVK